MDRRARCAYATLANKQRNMQTIKKEARKEAKKYYSKSNRNSHNDNDNNNNNNNKKANKQTDKQPLYAYNNEAILPRYEHSSTAPLNNKRVHTHTHTHWEGPKDMPPRRPGGQATSGIGIGFEALARGQKLCQQNKLDAIILCVTWSQSTRKTANNKQRQRQQKDEQNEGWKWKVRG